MALGHLSSRRGKERSGWPWKKELASVISLSRECRDTKKIRAEPGKKSVKDAVRKRTKPTGFGRERSQKQLNLSQVGMRYPNP
jgi:hypothetical protein